MTINAGHLLETFVDMKTLYFYRIKRPDRMKSYQGMVSQVIEVKTFLGYQRMTVLNYKHVLVSLITIL